MANYVVSDTSLTAVANAIRDKGKTSNPLQYPDGFVAAISAIEAGSPAEEKDVNFYDYDGTCLYSYTTAEFLALQIMPDNPSHAGLTAQGWNWTLEDAKTHVTKYGILDIGQCYITDDGSHRFYIHITEQNSTLTFKWNQTDDRGIIIKWGDGIEETFEGTGTLTTTHTYTPGNYILSCHILSGYFNFFEDSFGEQTDILHRKIVYAIEVGKRAASLPRMYYYPNLTTITIPTSVTIIGTLIGCPSLKHITIPSSVYTKIPAFYSTSEYLPGSALRTICLQKTAIIDTANQFNRSYSLKRCTVGNGIVNSMFYLCYSLSDCVITDTVTSIGQDAFFKAKSLDHIVIPSSVTSIASGAFSNCSSLKKIVLKPTTPPTLSSISAFSNINSEAKFIVPYSEDHSILSSYQSATNWSTYASKMEEAEP